MAAMATGRPPFEGNCLIGLLAPRQILLRFDQYEDYVLALSRSVNYLLYNGEEHQCRVFQWSIGYKPKEETTLAKSLLPITSAVGKPIAINKATQIKSKPSTTRVKVIFDLMEKLPNRITLQFVDGKFGHDEDSCRLISKKNQNNKQIDDTIEVSSKSTINITNKLMIRLKFLQKTIGLLSLLSNRAHSMNVVTSNIGVQTTNKYKGGTLRVGVDVPRVGSAKKIMDFGHKLMDISDVEDVMLDGAAVQSLCSVVAWMSSPS
ncbi:hypothetical protein H5410_040278 [Solanum commersonii]|uniref:Uncharacterized protein n=1 Tax=Solanum commersonii TaxID=4109 RepID=A0A9J5XQX4_SOLCO|nr:hypothetical protein H5410_040278 [Solanum commersonii]